MAAMSQQMLPPYTHRAPHSVTAQRLKEYVRARTMGVHRACAVVLQATPIDKGAWLAIVQRRGFPHLRLATCTFLFKMSEKKPFERLPTDVLPRNYKLELKPDLQAFTFAGRLEITVHVSWENLCRTYIC